MFCFLGPQPEEPWLCPKSESGRWDALLEPGQVPILVALGKVKLCEEPRGFCRGSRYCVSGLCRFHHVGRGAWRGWVEGCWEVVVMRFIACCLWWHWQLTGKEL